MELEIRSGQEGIEIPYRIFQLRQERLTDAGECTWHGLTTLIAGVVNPECRVEPCTTDEFPRPAPRPSYSVLDISATERVVGPLVPWQDRVRDVLARVES